jgi:hypothetical protein
MPKCDLRAPEKDSKTVLIWALENGLDASAIVIALNKRISASGNRSLRAS